MEKSERFWDRTARRYARQPVKDEEGYRKTLEDTRKYLGPEKTVLEIGCGTGTTALILAGDVGEFTATDISSKMIAIANEKRKSQNADNVHFLKATLFDDVLKREAFDVILAYNVIHLLEDTEQAMARIHALLKPGGIFISKTACLREQSRLWPMLAAVVGRLLRIGPIRSFSIADYEEAMTTQGFEIVETYTYFPKPPRLFAVAKKGAS